MKYRLLPFILSALLLAGCSKLTKENYDKLEAGMSREEVEAIIGDADNCSKAMGTQSCLWGEEEGTHVKVVFMADRAIGYSFDGL
ncbi:outer membrane protein assembly factor BamE [Alteromonas sp. ASW11-19]|uniref:Outer membrane protein assembly factor BamE n=1 Tax=Alteromonas salexigens TaxID=2982530 RepID=A0ABT2VLC3_9ALTE|nr:outer membrane protein assembly factor BamE [Alteromonas salexigens]MCU7553875.1 outer membrane protein assembly factor BamE [Alteromonas salexigens]